MRRCLAGHAICVHDDKETTIIGVLIQKETFFRSFLPMLSINPGFFQFLLNPATNCCSDEYLHFSIEDGCNIRTLLEMMVIEYADKQDDTQTVLKPLALSFLMQVARQYALVHGHDSLNKSPSEKIIQFMGGHPDTVTLKENCSYVGIQQQQQFL